MSVTLIAIDGRYHIPDRKRFLISSESDINDLPTTSKDGVGVVGRCSPGSMAHTPSMSSIFILGNDDVWHKAEVPTSSSSSSGEATKLAYARKIELEGDVTGSVSFDGSKDVSIQASVSRLLENELEEILR